jgi:hypothetical protein
MVFAAGDLGGRHERHGAKLGVGRRDGAKLLKVGGRRGIGIALLCERPDEGYDGGANH